jgi:hypothetical protein
MSSPPAESIPNFEQINEAIRCHDLLEIWCVSGRVNWVPFVVTINGKEPKVHLFRHFGFLLISEESSSSAGLR